jgi:O-methyltransferase
MRLQRRVSGSDCAGVSWVAHHIWLYDSFEGLPTPKEIDGLDATSYKGRCVGSEDAVRAALRIANVAVEDCTIRKG